MKITLQPSDFRQLRMIESGRSRSFVKTGHVNREELKPFLNCSALLFDLKGKGEVEEKTIFLFVFSLIVTELTL